MSKREIGGRVDVEKVLGEVRSLRNRLNDLSPSSSQQNSFRNSDHSKGRAKLNASSLKTHDLDSDISIDDGFIFPEREYPTTSSLKDHLNPHQKEDPLTKELEESQLLTKSLKKNLKDSSKEIKVQIEEKVGELRRKDDIEKGYNQVAEQLRNLVLEKEQEILQLKAEVCTTSQCN